VIRVMACLLILLAGCEADIQKTGDDGHIWRPDAKVAADLPHNGQESVPDMQAWRFFGEICSKNEYCFPGLTCLYITSQQGICTRKCCEGWEDPCSMVHCPSGWYCFGLCYPILNKN